MADVEAARAEINKAVAFLVGRFGHESDVFAHLTRALGHLRAEPSAEAAPAVEVTSDDTASEDATVEEPEPPQRGSRRNR